MNENTEIYNLLQVQNESKRLLGPFEQQTVDEVVVLGKKFDLLGKEYWNDFNLLHVSSILRKFTEILNLDEIGLKIKRETGLLLFLAFINRFVRIESWNQTLLFDVNYRVKDDDVSYFMAIDWQIDGESRIKEIEEKLDSFEWKSVKHEIYLIIFYQSENIIKYEVKSLTLYYSLKHITKHLQPFYSHLIDQISKEDFDLVTNMRPNYIMGRYESINQKMYDDKRYFKKSQFECLIDSINNFENEEVLEVKHIGLCYLAILNHFKNVQKWYEQRQDPFLGKNVLKFVYEYENQIKIEYLILCNNEVEEDAVKRIKCLNLFKKENHKMILLHSNGFEMEFEILDYNYCEQHDQQAALLPYPFQNESEVASFFKSISQLEFKECVSFYKNIEFQIGGKTLSIDSGQLTNAAEFHFDYLSNENVWKSFQIDRDPRNITRPIEMPVLQCETDLDRVIYDFVKKMHGEGMYKTCDVIDHYDGFLDTMSYLIESILGLEATWLQKTFEDSAHPQTIVRLFNELSEKRKERFIRNDLWELHLHVIFLIFLNMNLKIKSWHSDFECERLQSFLTVGERIENKKKSPKFSTGFCDLFYVDNEDNAIALEFKYFRTNYFKSLEDCKHFAIDQARSYQIEQYKGRTQCFAVVFYIEKTSGPVKCDLVSKPNGDGYDPYLRTICNKPT